MNDDEILKLLQMQLPEQKLYENYNPAAQFKQGLLTPSTQVQAQNNNQMAQQVSQAADAVNQQMIQNASTQPTDNGQLQAQQSQSEQMLQRQQEADARRRGTILKLGLMFMPLGRKRSG